MWVIFAPQRHRGTEEQRNKKMPACCPRQRGRLSPHLKKLFAEIVFSVTLRLCGEPPYTSASSSSSSCLLYKSV